MKIKAIALDFDGVIVESNEIKHRAFSQIFAQSPRYEQIMSYHYSHNHVCRQDKFRHILGNILKKSFQEADVAQLSKEFSELTRKEIITCPFVAGAEDFIKYFASKYPLYMASATPIDELMIITAARELNRYFKGIYGAPTKKAGIFADIFKKEKIAPADLLFIGDSKEDFDVAVHSGLQFIARVNGNSFQDIKAPKFKDLYEIKAFIVDGN
jgi:phosphoglycolate phosphatase-like HAD superfamily hydrolase